jgi:hypothetical protein
MSMFNGRNIHSYCNGWHWNDEHLLSTAHSFSDSHWWHHYAHQWSWLCAGGYIYTPLLQMRQVHSLSLLIPHSTSYWLERHWIKQEHHWTKVISVTSKPKEKKCRKIGMKRIRFSPFSMNHSRFTILLSYLMLVRIFTLQAFPSPLCSSNTLFYLFSSLSLPFFILSKEN